MKHRKTKTSIVVSLVAAAAATLGFVEGSDPMPPAPHQHISCVINLGRYNPHSRYLTAGYHYNLLQAYCADHGATAEIKIADKGTSPLDSLLKGKVNIVVKAISDSSSLRDSLIRIQVDSSALWVLSTNEEMEATHIRTFFNTRLADSTLAQIRSHYSNLFDPFRRAARAQFISPYDSLFKAYADTLGWDWRLLAAMAYQESNFRIEARSPRGAEGLMQMIPETGARYGANNLSDPEQSIRAGAKYLMNLQRRYSNAATLRERQKFTLAAYNAGQGRIRDCINYAQFRGVDAGYWDNIVSLIPEMRTDSITLVDTVKLGVFQGYETIEYVERIMGIYDCYTRVCP